ncbi:MAG: bifunctional adenosylcobinamide kinase/adenosylcobinamide-phosphate guanylyltransferase [Lachnospiraceae bacterium]|nr:bifunctional adenosylcobinamide kinase/adenosylcobinamide-phosphate guanylyltransferase [Lachnospiraceae bacterium]
MILVTGAVCSGKTDYVKSLGYDDADIGRSLTDDAPVLYGLEDLVKADPENALSMLDALLEKEVVVCSETGCGIVPLDKKERLAREATGRLMCALAEKAGRVVRMVCGIPQVIKEQKTMKLLMIRHSVTPGNALKQYIGRTDQPLAPEGIELAEKFGTLSGYGKVYVTKYQRTSQTADIIFPGAETEIVPGFEEMDFGDFEERSADEMENDTAYRKWVDDMCLSRCPGGEIYSEFRARVSKAFLKLLEREDRELIPMVVHGGTIMSLMDDFDEKALGYYGYWIGNCCGYVCDLEKNDDGIVFRNAVKISNAEETEEALK